MNRTTRAGLNKDLADATITRDPQKLKPAIKKAEKKKVSGTENYLLQAKKLYEQLQTATQLKGATFDRRIADIEAAIHAIKKGGFETLLAVELLEAQVGCFSFIILIIYFPREEELLPLLELIIDELRSTRPNLKETSWLRIELSGLKHKRALLPAVPNT